VGRSAARAEVESPCARRRSEGIRRCEERVRSGGTLAVARAVAHRGCRALRPPTTGRFEGRDAINERIAGFSERFPGARLTLASGVDEHNGFARYAWAINAADGSLILEGIDVVERDDGNRLWRVVMYFGPLPRATE
jgi:hypothetical protein